ncbi:MAG TPA: GNVR domain-containing protein, partial [Longimicrobiaceae bacterium]|nr:GNVR domain-containing protein [Longimicrobiaceae bacterium]
PNALVKKYLERRRTTDRGVNQRRYEFLAERTDSVRADLSRAEDALRGQQERSGMLDPAAFGDAELERGMKLRTDLDEAQVEERAFREVLNQVAAGSISARGLAAYPTLLGNPAINEILARLQTLESQRTELLDRRTPRDPDVILLNEQIQQVEDRLVALSRSYLDGVGRREAQLQSELSGYHDVLARLPAQAEAHYRLDREVRRLSETLVAMQTQLVQARLAAITEGGEARPVDTAVPPRKPAFPRPLLNLAIGLLGGLVLGMVGALGSHYLGNGVADPREAELASGVPVVRLDSRMPLLLNGAGARQSVLVVPVNEHASSLPVARSIASTAALQGVSVVLAILGDAPLERLPADGGAGTGVALAPLEPGHTDPLERAEAGDESGYPVYHGSRNGGSGAGARTALEELERRFSLVVAALPPLGHVSVTASLSAGRPVVAVATAGRVTRTELREMTGSLATAGIPLAGVVLRDGRGGDDSGA